MFIPSFPNLSADGGENAGEVISADSVAARMSASRKTHNKDDDETPERTIMSGDELSSQDESDADSDTDDAPNRKRQKLSCVCCDLATSAVVRAMDSVAGEL